MPQSARFWPNEGAELHGGIEVNLVTEHVWCREFLVRSLYLRQVRSKIFEIYSNSLLRLRLVKRVQ
jgi:hypothetical protein